MRCRGCLCQEEIYDCHLKDNNKGPLFGKTIKPVKRPDRFLDYDEVVEMIRTLDFRKVIFMGMEPTLDPELPGLAEVLCEEFHAWNILLTNGLKLISLDHMDEIVLSLKAWEEELHRDYTGVSSGEIKRNFLRIYSMGKRLRAESVLIPEYIDEPEIERISRFIAGIDRRIPYRIDAYFPAGKNPWRRATPEDVERGVKIARRFLADVSCIRGDEELRFEVVRIY